MVVDVVDGHHQTSGDFIEDQRIIDQVGKYLTRFIDEGRKSNFPILSKISNQLAIQIWITACQFIDKQLENDKAVQISQLGTFSFSSKRLDIGNNKFIIVQRPVFLLSQRLAQTHGLSYTKHHVSGEIPVVKMNFTAIAISMGKERDLVEGCIREIMQCLSRVIAYREPVSFIFYNIGFLMVRDFRARVKFTPDFIKRMDGTGELFKLIETKKSSKKSGKMVRAKTSAGRIETVSDCMPMSMSRGSETDILTLPTIDERRPSLIENNSKSNIPTANIYSTEDVQRSVRRTSPANRRAQSATSVASSVTEPTSNFDNEIPLTDNLSYVAFQRQKIEEEKRAREARADAILQRYQDNKDTVAMEREKNQHEHAKHRAKNVAAFNLKTCLEASEEELNQKRRRSGSARAYIFKNRPLTPARFQKQEEYSNELAEQVNRKSNKKSNRRHDRDENERCEQYHLAEEIEEMMKETKAQRLQNQKNYRKALSSQIRVKEEITKKSDEQEELAEPSIPNVPYFGRNHITQDKAIEEKARARALFKAQLSMAAEKRRSSIKKHLRSQQSESEVLRRTKTELVADQRQQYESAVERRRSLEANWIKHAKEQRGRERQNKEFMKNDRILMEKDAELHDKYSILFKAQPTGYHSGRFKSNIWRESRYIPGSRLMV